MATRIWAHPTIKEKSEHTSSPVRVTTRPILSSTPRDTIAPPSTAATAIFPPTMTLRALAEVMIDRATLPDALETSFTNRVLTEVRGHQPRIHLQLYQPTSNTLHCPVCHVHVSD